MDMVNSPSLEGFKLHAQQHGLVCLGRVGLGFFQPKLFYASMIL